MIRLLLALLLLAAPALAQLRSGPDAPAVGAQIPPTSLPGDRSGGEPAASERQRDDPPRTSPPPGHRVLEAPPVPGATQPDSSEGFTTSRDRIPPDVGDRIRPDASATGR